MPRPWISRTSRSPASQAAATYSSTTDGISRGANGCRSSAASIGTRTRSVRIFQVQGVFLLRTALKDVEFARPASGHVRMQFLERAALLHRLLDDVAVAAELEVEFG